MVSPSISVVIPTYNCSGLLPNAIRSAYGQTIPPAEVIVVDDGCTDDTAKVVRRLAESLPSSFTFIQKPNGGEASARNCGVSAATGEYVAFLDQDDVWLPEKFARQLPLFDAVPSPSLTFTAYVRISGDSRKLVCVEGWEATAEHALRRLMEGCCVTPSTVMVCRAVLGSAGPFDESLWLGNDWDMWLRLAAAGHRFAYLPKPMTNYLWHATNMSRDRRKIADAALTILPRLFRSGTLPPALQREERRCLARWNLNRACYALDEGEGLESRRSLAAAARTRPSAIRPGWFVLGLRSIRHGEVTNDATLDPFRTFDRSPLTIYGLGVSGDRMKGVLARLVRAVTWRTLLILRTDHERRVAEWYKLDTDGDLRLRYPLHDQSVVLDVGGYKGQWASDIFSMYRCAVHVYEPVPAFADLLERRFAKNPSITIYREGVGGSTRQEPLYVQDDASTMAPTARRSKTIEEVIRLCSIAEVIEGLPGRRIDLLKLNIEGAEYEVLECLLDGGYLDRIGHLQIQFHAFAEHAERRRVAIHERLRATHDLAYCVPFVWESWAARADTRCILNINRSTPIPADGSGNNTPGDAQEDSPYFG